MIESTKNAQIKTLSALIKKSKVRDEEGLYVVEGRRMFEEAPEAEIKKIYLSAGFAEHFGKDPSITEKLEKVGYEVLSDSVYEYVSDTKTPQGIMCIMKQKKYSLEQVMSGEDPFLLLVEDLQDPGNLGTMIRAGEGAGITGVIMTSNTVDIYNPKTIRSTMGSVFRLPFCYVADLKEVLEIAGDKGIRTYAAHLQGENPYDREDYSGGCAIIIGNEGKGIRPETAKRAGKLVKIPMKGEVESLNAAVAATVLMYEVARQRR